MMKESWRLPFQNVRCNKQQTECRTAVSSFRNQVLILNYTSTNQDFYQLKKTGVPGKQKTWNRIHLNHPGVKLCNEMQDSLMSLKGRERLFQVN